MTATPGATRFTGSLLAGLEEPVRRYLSHAIGDGAELGTGVSLRMTGRIKVGLWLPFRARQECDGCSFAWRARVGLGPLTALAVVDRFAEGLGSVEGRLLGRVKLFEADDESTSRSAAGRAALEAVYTPASLLPQRGVNWRAESESEIVASWEVPPERPELHLEIDDRGAVRAYWAWRWATRGRRRSALRALLGLRRTVVEMSWCRRRDRTRHADGNQRPRNGAATRLAQPAAHDPADHLQT